MLECKTEITTIKTMQHVCAAGVGLTIFVPCELRYLWPSLQLKGAFVINC